LKVLKDMLAENPKQQIMMIASYKNILSYMFDAIRHHNICTVGYYVGGMKESALKESESKQVVLATFSMAAEGLDIKSLTTLFMITPMTNIEQSVGRILRQKHEFAPIVVDIIDSHDNFQRQWVKRKCFYKKQNYKIIQTNSFNYVPDTSTWKVINNPTKTKNVAIKMETKLAFKCTKNDTKNNKEFKFDEELEADENNETNDINKFTSSVCLLKFKK
jgi:superfamily II DNA or RNA helicase